MIEGGATPAVDLQAVAAQLICDIGFKGGELLALGRCDRHVEGHSASAFDGLEGCVADFECERRSCVVAVIPSRRPELANEAWVTGDELDVVALERVHDGRAVGLGEDLV